MIESLEIFSKPSPCWRARCRAASTANELEKGGDFEGILPKTLLGGHDADLGVTGARPAKGEAAEGSVVRRSCSNPLTCFAHVDRCALPGIGELACMMILHTLTDLALRFGRCKTRAKMVAIQDSGGEIQKAGSLDFEIDFEFSCRTFSWCSKADEILGSPHLLGRFRAQKRPADRIPTPSRTIPRPRPLLPRVAPPRRGLGHFLRPLEPGTSFDS